MIKKRGRVYGRLQRPTVTVAQSQIEVEFLLRNQKYLSDSYSCQLKSNWQIMIVQVSKDIICSGQVMNLLNTE